MMIVKADRGFRRAMLICNILFDPLCFTCFFVILIAAFVGDVKVSEALFGILAGIELFTFISFSIYFQKKEIKILGNGMWITSIFQKKKFYRVDDIKKVEVIYRKIQIYDKSGDRIIKITSLYEGYKELVEWCRQKGIDVEVLKVDPEDII